MAVTLSQQYHVGEKPTVILLCTLLFITFSVLVANPQKLLYTLANSARGLLNREKRIKKRKSGNIWGIYTGGSILFRSIRAGRRLSVWHSGGLVSDGIRGSRSVGRDCHRGWAEVYGRVEARRCRRGWPPRG